jgi:hypothetical protein
MLLATIQARRGRNQTDVGNRIHSRSLLTRHDLKS